MVRFMVVIFSIMLYQVLDIVSSNAKYEAILENATECSNPQPPYATKRTWLSTFSFRRHKNITYLSGWSKVLAEVPFTDQCPRLLRLQIAPSIDGFVLRSYPPDRSFNVDTFKVESGQEQRLLHVDRQNCRSWLGKMFLVMGNFRYSNKDCRVLKGTVRFSEVDMNKVFHSYPTWHSTGRFIHRPRLVYNGTTVFCMEISVWIRNVNV